MKYVLILILAPLLFASCKKEVNGIDYKLYKIRNHYSSHGVKSVGNYLKGSAIFTESCSYDDSGYDQVNKLVGISIDKFSPHNNSLRIGWRCLDASDVIELLAYYYIEGVRHEEFICTVKTSEAFDYTLSVDDGYSITINSHQWININNVVSEKRNWVLYPYFGGSMAFSCSIYGDNSCKIMLKIEK